MLSAVPLFLIIMKWPDYALVEENRQLHCTGINTVLLTVNSRENKVTKRKHHTLGISYLA